MTPREESLQNTILDDWERLLRSHAVNIHFIVCQKFPSLVLRSISPLGNTHLGINNTLAKHHTADGTPLLHVTRGDTTCLNNLMRDSLNNRLILNHYRTYIELLHHRSICLLHEKFTELPCTLPQLIKRRQLINTPCKHLKLIMQG